MKAFHRGLDCIAVFLVLRGMKDRVAFAPLRRVVWYPSLMSGIPMYLKLALVWGSSLISLSHFFHTPSGALRRGSGCHLEAQY